VAVVSKLVNKIVERQLCTKGETINKTKQNKNTEYTKYKAKLENKKTNKKNIKKT